jgi:thermolabile hemolysin
MQIGNMKALLHLVGVCLVGFLELSAQAGVTSLYAFGDSVSTTTNNTSPSVTNLYYGHRYCNGRVWVEVLAQRQGVAYDPNKNWSYFGHYSSDLVTNLNHFPSPPDAKTALFIVWVCNADSVYDLNQIDPPYSTNASLAAWTAAISQSLTNHSRAIQTLYAKGARTLIMPNAADITKVPYYAYLAASDKTFVRQRILEFNAGFGSVLDHARASLAGLVIQVPDVFALLDDMVARPGDYGLSNATIDAIDDPALTDKSLNGPGANYLFWDYLDPTAKVQARIADIAQQLVAPVKISNLTALTGSNRLDMANVPIGRDGFLQASTDFVNWATVQSFASTNASQSIFVPVSGPWECYRLGFPFSWSWP